MCSGAVRTHPSGALLLDRLNYISSRMDTEDRYVSRHARRSGQRRNPEYLSWKNTGQKNDALSVV